MQKLFVPTLLVSLALGAYGVFHLSQGGRIDIYFYLATAWLVLTIFGLIAFRWRGLWLLTGAPLALGPALFVGLYLYACMPKSCL
jgi:hypothetical protein